VRLDAIGERALQLPLALEQLSQALMDDIGGSMGPLYGSFFSGLADTLAPYAQLDAALFGDSLAAAVANVERMGNARVGDKTLMDTLLPALAAYQQAMADGGDFAAALQAMHSAAEQGRDSTRNLQARIGRSARLGPRSIGVLDAGATSCCLILQTMVRSLEPLLTPR
jgi:dihydroxyacetone kinase